MKTLSDRLRLAEVKLTTQIIPRAADLEGLDLIMDELIDISIQAAAKRNFKLLGSMESVTRKLGINCLQFAEKAPWITKKYLNSFMVEADEVTGFLKDPYPGLKKSVQTELLEALIDNVLAHETFYSRAKPRVAQEILEALLKHTDRPSPLIRLCEAVAMSNTKDVAGANFVIMAIKNAISAQAQAQAEIDASKALIQAIHAGDNDVMTTLDAESLGVLTKGQQALSSPHLAQSRVIQAALHWLKASEVNIAESIHDGEVCEWTNARSVSAAREFEVPLIAAHLSTRIDAFEYSELAEAAINLGIYTDSKHGASMFEKTNFSINCCAGVLAYSLIHKDVLPASFPKGRQHEILEKAVELMDDDPINADFGQSVLERFFSAVPPFADMSKLSKSHIHRDLMKIKKYNGMRLENDMGL